VSEAEQLSGPEQGTGTELEQEQEAQRKQELEPWNAPEPAELQPWNEREPSEQKAGQSLAAEPLEREEVERD
jgi:hypothetical protein